MKGCLKEVFEKIDSQKWSHMLYIAEGALSLESLAAVAEDDGESDIYEGLHYFLSIQDVQSIVENLRIQLNDPTPGQFLEALRHYHANDAFIQIQE